MVSLVGPVRLVNNAGILHFDALEDTSIETWNKVISVNQTSVFLGLKAAAEELRKSKNGSVVNLASFYGIVGTISAPAYGASKGAIRILTKTAALGWAKEGIRVNSVHPGFIKTPIQGDGGITAG